MYAAARQMYIKANHNYVHDFKWLSLTDS